MCDKTLLANKSLGSQMKDLDVGGDKLRRKAWLTGFNGRTTTWRRATTPIWASCLLRTSRRRAFHKSFPQYTVTPLARLDNLAARLGLNNLCVKDESYRFGLNAFKVLGGSFAMASYIADETGRDVADMTYDYLTSEELARDFGQATFFTATMAKNFNEILEPLSGLDYSDMYNNDFLHTWDKTTDELKALYETAASRVEIAVAALRRRGA